MKPIKEDPRLVKLTERVKALKNDVNIDTIYMLILSGHSVYLQGIGLPEETVKDCIEKALKEEDNA